MAEPAQILLVDDDPRNLDALDAILACPEHDLVRATSAEAALLALLHGEFAVIVLDIKMPGMSGLELAQLVKQRKRTQNIPIVFLTAHYPDERDALAGYGAGAVDYLTKPLNPQILRSKIDVFVDLFRKTRALAAANRELEDANARLRAVNEGLERFGQTVSHDLRGPLRGMRVFSDTVLNEYGAQIPAEARSYIQCARDCANKLDTLVEALLAFSQLGRQPLNKQHVPTVALVNDVLGDLAELRVDRSVTIEVGDLPDCEADPSLLRQVWYNLLANAHKFTRHRPRAHIQVGSTMDREGPAYYVKDNGDGFDKEDAGHLFQAFHRLHKDNEFEGTGIGLSIVHRIVERHGGRVWVAEASPGSGATFCFLLPQARNPAPAVDAKTDACSVFNGAA